MYQYILFDLDGTLTDPGLGITNSVMHALKKYNIMVEDRASLYKFIGPPLTDSFETYYGFSEEESERAVSYYREYFSEKGLFENTIYPDIEQVLQTLKQQGKSLILATSKPEVYAKQILEHFHLDGYFDFISGATMDKTRVKKQDIIAYAIEQCNLSELSKAIMIGDREHDIFGAKACQMASLGVLYGYGSREELTAAGADYLAQTPTDILKFL